MYKEELIERVAKRTRVEPTLAKIVVEGLLVEVTAALKKGKKVQVTGFGTFVVRRRKKATYHDISTGGKVTVPAHKLPAFVAGTSLIVS